MKAIQAIVAHRVEDALSLQQRLATQEPQPGQYQHIDFHPNYLSVHCALRKGLGFESLIDYDWVRMEAVENEGIIFETPRGNVYYVSVAQFVNLEEFETVVHLSKWLNSTEYVTRFGLKADSRKIFPAIEGNATPFEGAVQWPTEIEQEPNFESHGMQHKSASMKKGDVSTSFGLPFVTAITTALFVALLIALKSLVISTSLAISSVPLLLVIVDGITNQHTPKSRTHVSPSMIGWLTDTTIIHEMPGQRNVIQIAAFESIERNEDEIKLTSQNTIVLTISRKQSINKNRWADIKRHLEERPANRDQLI